KRSANSTIFAGFDDFHFTRRSSSISMSWPYLSLCFGGPIGLLAFSYRFSIVPGQPEHKQTLRRIVPTRFPHTGWDIANIIPGGWEVIRKTQRRIVLEKLSWLQINIDVLHVSFAVSIGKDAKACHVLVASTSK